MQASAGNSVQALVARQVAAKNALEAKVYEADYSDEEMASWQDAYHNATDAVFGGLILSHADVAAAIEYAAWHIDNFDFGPKSEQLLSRAASFLRMA